MFDYVLASEGVEFDPLPDSVLVGLLSICGADRDGCFVGCAVHRFLLWLMFIEKTIAHRNSLVKQNVFLRNSCFGGIKL